MQSESTAASSQISKDQPSGMVEYGLIETKPQDLAETSCVVVPKTPDANSPSNSSSPVHSICSIPHGPGKVIMGTLSAISTLKRNTFASFKQYGTPYWNDSVGISESPRICCPAVTTEKVLLCIAYQRILKVLLRPDGRYSRRDQCPSGLSGQRGEVMSFLEFRGVKEVIQVC